MLSVIWWVSVSVCGEKEDDCAFVWREFLMIEVSDVGDGSNVLFFFEEFLYSLSCFFGGSSGGAVDDID